MKILDRKLLAALAGLMATLVIFAIWPDIDMKVARAFYGDEGFIGGGAFAKAARDFFRITPYALLILACLAWALRKLGAPIPFAPSGRAALFLLLTMAVGPGLIVNAALKEHAHRPRPVHVTEFGGPDAFKAWDEFDGRCKANCSFASGEAAQGFWMIAPALLAPPAWRAAALVGAMAFGIGASALRMAFGGHFLSDVLVGGLISLIVILIAHQLIWRRLD